VRGGRSLGAAASVHKAMDMHSRPPGRVSTPGSRYRQAITRLGKGIMTYLCPNGCNYHPPIINKGQDAPAIAELRFATSLHGSGARTTTASRARRLFASSNLGPTSSSMDLEMVRRREIPQRQGGGVCNTIPSSEVEGSASACSRASLKNGCIMAS
jgi:hypothetical protein